MKWHNTMRQIAHLSWECTAPQTFRVRRNHKRSAVCLAQVTNPQPPCWGSRGLLSIQVLQLLCLSAQHMVLLYEENKPCKPRGKRSFHTGEIKFREDVKPEPPNRQDRSGIMASGILSWDSETGSSGQDRNKSLCKATGMAVCLSQLSPLYQAEQRTQEPLTLG